MADEPDNEIETPEEPGEAAEQTAAPVQTQGAAGAVPSAQPEPAEQLPPKERRRKARSTHTGQAGKTRSPEERHAERVAERKTKAARRRTRRLQEREKERLRATATVVMALCPSRWRPCTRRARACGRCVKE